MMAVMEISLWTAPNFYKDKWQGLEDRKDQLEILVLGNSHFLDGVDPAQFVTAKAYNLAFPSQDITKDFALLKRAGAQCPNLKHIIFPAEYMSRHYLLNQGSEGWRKWNYDWELGLPATDIQDYFNPRRYMRTLRHSLRHNFDLLIKEYDSEHQLGWVRKKGHRAEDFDRQAVQTAGRHQKEISKETDLSEVYAKVIAFAEEKGYGLSLVMPPLSPPYREGLDGTLLSESRSYFDSLANEYDHVQFLDFSDSKKVMKSDFFDADHLNEEGAKKWSKLLIESIRPAQGIRTVNSEKVETK